MNYPTAQYFLSDEVNELDKCPTRICIFSFPIWNVSLIIKGELWFPLFTTILTSNVGDFHTRVNSQTLHMPAGCPTIQLWHQLPGVSTDPQVKHSVLQDCPHFRYHHKSWLSSVLLTNQPSSGSIICYEGSQNSGKHICWFIIQDMIKDIDEQADEGFHKAKSRGSWAQELLSLWSWEGPTLLILECVSQPTSSPNPEV